MSGSISLYLASIQQSDHLLFDSNLLTPHDEKRCKKFRQLADRKRCAIGAILTRHILGGRLNIPPDSVPIEHTAFGKPVLAEIASDLQFNLSHSGDWIYLAVCAQQEVGIDIELCKPIDNIESLIRFTYHTSEQEKMLNQPTDLWLSWFYSCWTRKEAVLKAVGKGLQIAPEQFEINPNPTHTQQQTTLQAVDVLGAQYRVIDIEAASGYKAALSFSNPVEKVHQPIYIRADQLETFLRRGVNPD